MREADSKGCRAAKDSPRDVGTVHRLILDDIRFVVDLEIAQKTESGLQDCH